MFKTSPIAICLFLCAISALLATCATAPYTGRSQFLLLSHAEEGQLGLQAWNEVITASRPSSNRRMSNMVSRVGRRIAAVAKHDEYQWEFTVIADPQVNAFALPGGKVAFYEGILSVCENEAGVAVVMGHEVGHAIARHGNERISQAMLTQLGTEVASSVLGGDDPETRELVRMGLGIGANVAVTLPFSRKHESEADYIGLMLMAEAGYDPRAAPSFWKRMAAASSGSTSFEFLSTHPHHDTRVEQLEGWMPEALALYERSVR